MILLEEVFNESFMEAVVKMIKKMYEGKYYYSFARGVVFLYDVKILDGYDNGIVLLSLPVKYIGDGTCEFYKNDYYDINPQQKLAKKLPTFYGTIGDLPELQEISKNITIMFSNKIVVYY